MKKTKNSYKKSGVNMATANKLVNYISKISRKTYKKNTEKKSFKKFNTINITKIIIKIDKIIFIYYY